VDHQYVEKHGIPDRYLMGKLPPEEVALFEEHYLDCQECLDLLETTERFRRGLKSVAAEEVARSNAYVKAGPLPWLVRPQRWQFATLLLAALLLSILPAIFFARKNNRAQDELNQARAAAAEWQRKSAEGHQASASPGKELPEAEGRSDERHRQAGPGREGEQGERGEVSPAAKTGGAKRPKALIPAFALSMVRSAGAGESEPANKITITRATPRVVLSLEMVADQAYQSYGVKLFDAGRSLVWSGSNLKPLSPDALRITLGTELLHPGDYLLVLEGLTRDGRSVPEGEYRFRIINTK
jgi:hypothetical protein